MGLVMILGISQLFVGCSLLTLVASLYMKDSNVYFHPENGLAYSRVEMIEKTKRKATV